MIVTRDERKEFAAPEQNASDAVGLVGRLDEEFGDVADEVAVLVVGLSAQEFRGVQHFSLLSRQVNRLPEKLTRTATPGCASVICTAKAGQASVPVLPNVDCQWCGFGGNSGALHASLKALRLKGSG